MWVKKVVFDVWECVFFCLCKCYIVNWDEYRRRYGLSIAGSTKMDGVVYEFEVLFGFGVFWYGLDL